MDVALRPSADDLWTALFRCDYKVDRDQSRPKGQDYDDLGLLHPIRHSICSRRAGGLSTRQVCLVLSRL